MADFDYDEFNSGYAESYADRAGLADKARRWINIGGAVCSVSLVLGLAFWGYRLAVRDVTGVPVMRAMAGAMRIAPEDPGGEQALNQGLTVNAIAAVGTAAAPADQIVLAPTPVTLAADDAPQAAPAEAGVTVAGNAAPAETVTAEAAAPAVLPDATETADAEAPVDPSVIVTNDPNVIRVSLRPHARPGAPVAADKAAPTKVQAVSSQPVAKASELDPASIPVGTRLAQLGAFETPDLAREKFAELQGSFGDLMAGKSIVIQSAQSGGRTFYRLRAHGFASDEDARSFCAALLAEETDCIPVAQR